MIMKGPIEMARPRIEQKKKLEIEQYRQICEEIRYGLRTLLTVTWFIFIVNGSLFTFLFQISDRDDLFAVKLMVRMSGIILILLSLFFIHRMTVFQRERIHLQRDIEEANRIKNHLYGRSAYYNLLVERGKENEYRGIQMYFIIFFTNHTLIMLLHIGLLLFWTISWWLI